MNNLASALSGEAGERIALCDVSVCAVLHDLLAEVTVSQTYRNDEQMNIEAVYTFPLPLDAVLLDLEVDIGGRLLRGVVVEKKTAEEKYEDAVASGDSAVMLETLEPGLFTMNVGNLLPQETARITFRYALLYRWNGERLRFFLPTTVAPRYGATPHLPHQAPEASLTVENRFSLRVEVHGALREARFECPTHAVVMERSPEASVVTLQQARAVMDRDFILNVHLPNAERNFAMLGRDGEGMAAIASFQPFFPGLHQPRALSMAIVIDCSGSMNGESISHAKRALETILDGLQPQDHVILIAFGSSTRASSKRVLPCNESNVAGARQFAQSLAADMGGTEISKALRTARVALGVATPGDIFLVTDGEVAAWEAVVEEASPVQHRIFTVGVGSAVSESFLRGLSSATGGACELVTPREGMADRVVRHFERMRAPRTRRAVVHWPDGAGNVSPKDVGPVFNGDTVVATATFACFPAQTSVTLEIETEQGETLRQCLALQEPMAEPAPDGLSTTARLAAAWRLTELDDATGRETALRYRLISPWTNLLIVAPRTTEEAASTLPELRKVPQSLAAGWGGLSRVDLSTPMGGPVSASMPLSLDLDASLFSETLIGGNFKASESHSAAESRRQDWDDVMRSAAAVEIPAHHRRIIDLIALDVARLDPAHALELMEQAGVAGEFEDIFRRASELDISVDIVAAFLLAHILSGPLHAYLPDEAYSALMKLLHLSHEAMDALHMIGAMGSEIESLLDRPGARAIFGQRTGTNIVDWFRQVPDLIASIEKATTRA